MSDEKKFGELKELSMRDAWSHEAHDFTPWLRDNISALNEVLDLNLRAVNTEVKVGRFYLDLLAEEKDGRIAVIENQFNHTDHSHLGQLLTYATGFDAKILIWVTEHVQEEHRATIEWLNRRTDIDTQFYLVKVEVLKIDDSLPAYKFIPVVTANKWQKETHGILTVKTPEDMACGKYFHYFIEELKKREFPLNLQCKHRDSTRHRWFSLGVREWVIGHEFNDKYAMVYLYFYMENKETALILLDKLLNQKESFTSEIKDLEWDGWHYACVGVSRDSSFSESENALKEIRQWAVDSMFKFAEVFTMEKLRTLEKTLEKEENKIEE